MLSRPACARNALTLCALLGVACRGPATHGVEVERYDVAISLSSDGSVDVIERIGVRPTGPGPGQLVREIRLDRIDRIERLSADVDGRPLDPSHVTSAVRPDVARIVWSVEGAPAGSPSGTRLLRASYRAAGAVPIEGVRGHLRWQALPGDRPFTVGASRLELNLAPGVAPVEPPGIETAGWTVDWHGAGVVAVKTPVAPEDRATLLASVGFDVTPASPQWQYDADRARELTPAFLSGGLFILIIGAGVLGILRFQYPKARAVIDPPADRADVPVSLTVALARRRTRRAHAPALITAGLIDRERWEAARALRSAGLVVIVFGVVCVGLTPVLLWRYEWPPVVMAASIVVVGLMFVAAAPAFPVLTQAGATVVGRVLGGTATRGPGL
jgi:hypothetical protein